MFLEDELQRGGWIDDFNSQVPPAISLAQSSDGVTDRVAISYKTEINGVANRDCNGSVVADGYVTNQFFVGGATGEEFLCQGNGGGAAQPLIDGVKNFQVLYGVETNGQCPDGAVNQYMTHDQVVAAGPGILVVSVRVALILGSERNVLDVVEANTYDILDTQMDTNDQLAYRTFQQTIFMPNALYSTAGNPDKGITCLAGAVGG
ncbi:MAG: PilW family protein [Enterobacterales bacterium]|nr:PilW family protein [Enterobacterales bacterium]